MGGDVIGAQIAGHYSGAKGCIITDRQHDLIVALAAIDRVGTGAHIDRVIALVAVKHARISIHVRFSQRIHPAPAEHLKISSVTD
jgi:hypothetical protein